MHKIDYKMANVDFGKLASYDYSLYDVGLYVIFVRICTQYNTTHIRVTKTYNLLAPLY